MQRVYVTLDIIDTSISYNILIEITPTLLKVHLFRRQIQQPVKLFSDESCNYPKSTQTICLRAESRDCMNSLTLHKQITGFKICICTNVIHHACPTEIEYSTRGTIMSMNIRHTLTKYPIQIFLIMR